MVKWLIPATVIAIVAGGGLFAVGMLYGVLTVGVPTPDAPPAVAARENRDVARSGVVMATGLAVAAIGALGLAIVVIARWRASNAAAGISLGSER